MTVTMKDLSDEEIEALQAECDIEDAWEIARMWKGDRRGRWSKAKWQKGSRRG